MTAQLRSELVKLRSTRTNLGLLVGMVGLVLFVVIISGFTMSVADLGLHKNQTALFSLGLTGGFVAGLIGVMSICSEFRHGTIRPTFVFTPKRGRVLSAKLVSCLMLGTAFGLVTEALAFGAGAAVLAIRGVGLELSLRDGLLIAFGSIGVSALMAAFGLGFGSIVRNQVFAVIGLIIWLFIVETTLTSVAPGVGKFFPMAAADAMSGVEAEKILTASQGALLLVGYVIALFIAGTAITRRLDVK